MKLPKSAPPLFAILRKAIGGDITPSLEFSIERLTPEEWVEIVSLARSQAVTGLLYDTLSKLEFSVSIPDETSFNLMLESDRIERRSRKVRDLASSLVSSLSSDGLHPVILKGPSVAEYYPNPDLRVSGDIDIFVPEPEFDAARDSLAKIGGSPHSAPDGSWHVRVEEIDIDLHNRYFDLSAPDEKLPPVPSPEATILMLSSHILKHAIGTGVGLRQICDMASAFRALSDSVDQEYLRSCIKATGTFRWNRMLSSMINNRLGVDSGLFSGETDAPFKSLERIIFSGGNFGHYSSSRQKALSKSSGLRKVDTAKRLASRAPFAIHYAPREYARIVLSLARGNFNP